MTSLGCGMHAQVVWEDVTGMSLPITIVVDSMGVHRTVSLQENLHDFAMVPDVHVLRMDYESGLVATMSWMPGKKIPRDAITKPLSEKLQVF